MRFHFHRWSRSLLILDTLGLAYRKKRCRVCGKERTELL